MQGPDGPEDPRLTDGRTVRQAVKIPMGERERAKPFRAFIVPCGGGGEGVFFLIFFWFSFGFLLILFWFFLR